MEINNRPININISTSAIIKVILVFLLAYFLFLVRDILAILFVSLILASALDPWVDWMQERKIPRALGVIFIYFSIMLILSSVLYLLIPPIIAQLGELSNNFPRYLEKIISGFSSVKEFSVKYGILDNMKNSLGSLSSNLEKAAGGLFTTISGIFGGIFSFILMLVLTFYMVVEENAIKKLVWSIAPAKHQPYVMQLINRMQKKIGLWLRGQLILDFVIFALVYLGLYFIFGMKYALVLALIAGITENIPYVGPILGAIPAVLIAFTISPLLALFIAIFYFVVQWVENNILVPKIMEKMIGMNPIISIVALLVGYQVAGVVGAILSLPVTTAASVFIKDLFDHKESEAHKA